MKLQKEILRARISWLKRELVMEGHLDGWTLKGLKKELKLKVEKLTKLLNK
jgi:hypothetical protein